MIQIFSPTIRRREMDSVLTCMVDEKIGPGDLNTRFVNGIKEFTGCAGAVVFRNAAIALSYALKALIFPKESKIMISSLAPKWQRIALEELGYSIILLDVDQYTACVTSETVSKGIEQGGKLLVVSEPFGLIPDMQSILELGIPIIEDISESVGGERNEKKAGSFGVYSILSLEETDVITAGGGAVLCFNEKKAWEQFAPIYRKILKIDVLPDLNCALGYVGLKEFRKNEEARKNIYNLFKNAVMQGRRHKVFSREEENNFTVHSFPVIVANGSKEVCKYADRKEIETKMAFSNSVISDIMDTEEAAFYPVASSLYLRTILMPLYPRLRASQIEIIAKVLATLP